jgi:hypothetical protein
MNPRATQLTASLILLMPSLASAQVLWKGDFETNDLSQWSGTLNPAIGTRQNITIVDSPVSGGKHAAQIVIHPDDIFPNGHNRVELRYEGKRTAEGQTTFFSWRFQLPANVQVHEDIAYWETKGPDYRQSMAFYVDPVEGQSQLGFRTNLPLAREQWKALVKVGEWHQIAMKILWAKDADQGRVSVWFDGKEVVDAPAQTKPNVADLFIQMGFHRDSTQPPVETIYLDDAIEGMSLDVLPAGSAQLVR